MNRKSELVVATTIDLLLGLDPLERRDAFDAILHNDIFCVECGQGSADRPNSNCQCWNDE